MNDDEPEEEVPIVRRLDGCQDCGSKNTYTCLTKNRMFCWDCGVYYGSSH